MPRITLSKSAVDKLIDDRDVRRRWYGGRDGEVQVLWYYQRSYSTAHDGTVTEHGDGFSLTTIDAAEAKQAKGIVLTSVTVCDGFHILVGADESMMSGDVTIGWSKRKFTYEPQVST